MLLLNNRVPKIGGIYVASCALSTNMLRVTPSFTEPNKSIKLFEPGLGLEPGDQVLLLEKNLSENSLLQIQKQGDSIVYKFFFLRIQSVVYLRMSGILGSSWTPKDLADAYQRAAHIFCFHFMNLDDHIKFRLSKPK